MVSNSARAIQAARTESIDGLVGAEAPRQIDVTPEHAAAGAMHQKQRRTRAPGLKLDQRGAGRHAAFAHFIADDGGELLDCRRRENRRQCAAFGQTTFSMRAAIRTARSEWPPKSKKWSSMPIGSTPRTSSQIRVSSNSTASLRRGVFSFQNRRWRIRLRQRAPVHFAIGSQRQRVELAQTRTEPCNRAIARARNSRNWGGLGARLPAETKYATKRV